MGRLILTGFLFVAFVFPLKTWGEPEGKKDPGNKSLPLEKKQNRVDLYGDPLPPGALARMGTVRFRHHNFIQKLAVSPDGKIAATAGEWGQIPGVTSFSIRLWNLATGKEIHELRGHSILPCSLVFSPDGKILASMGGTTYGSRDDTVRIWDVVTGQTIQVFKGHQESPRIAGDNAVAFSPDGMTVASSGQDGNIRLWEAATGKEIRRWLNLFGGNSLTFSGDGNLLAALRSPELRLWEVCTGQEIKAFKLKTNNWFNKFQFSPGKGEIILGNNGGTVHWWNWMGEKEIRQVRGYLLGFSPGGKIAAILGENEIQIWDVGQGKELRSFRCGESITRLSLGSLSTEGNTLVVNDWNTIRVFDTRSGKETSFFPGHSSWAAFVGFFQNGSQLISAGDSTLRFWDLATAKELRQIKAKQGTGPIITVSMTPDGKTMATGGLFMGVRLWDTTAGQELGKIMGQWDLDEPFAVSPDSKTLAVGVYGGGPGYCISLWDLPNRRELRRFPSGGWFHTFLPNGQILTSKGSSYSIFDPENGKQLRQVEVMPDMGLTGKALSTDGRIAVTGLYNLWERQQPCRHQVTMLEIASGRIITQLGGHHGPVKAFAFTPDNKVLATGAWDGSVKLWEVGSGRELQTLFGHRGGIISLAFSPDAKLLASGGSDSTALVWDVATITANRRWPGTQLAEENLGKSWMELLSYDAARAYRTLWKMVGSPERTVPFLKENFWHVTPNERRLAQLLAEIDDPRFHIREKATHELRGFGPELKAKLHQVLKDAPSEEYRRRLEKVLVNLQLPEGHLAPQHLRGLRAIQVLEYIATVDARNVLKTLAGEDPDGRFGKEARLSLERLNRTSPLP